VDTELRKVQVKTVRTQPWYVRAESFVGDLADQVTIYVLIGAEDAQKPVRYFIARNCDLAEHVHQPPGWRTNAFIGMKALAPYENHWETLLKQQLRSDPTSN
jgi:hypothetical protein